MRAVVLTAPRTVEIQDIPIPKLRQPTDVLLRVEAVGICGSDIHYYTRGRIGSQVVRYPFRLGHECSGQVVQTGQAVRRVKPGERVAVDPAQWCGRCDQCRTGRFHTCRHIRFLGTPGQADGCLCEWIVMPESSCYPVGSSFTSEMAALVEPLSIGVYAVRLAGRPLGGTRLAILGFGPIGMSVLLAARAQRPARIYVTDRRDDRIRRAQRAGAAWAGNPEATDVVAAMARREPLQLDAVFECCGCQSALDQAVALLKPGGVLVIVGIPETERISFCIDSLRRKEIRVVNVRRQNECVEPALALARHLRLRSNWFVTHRFPLERTAEAFEDVAAYADGVFKAMVLP